MGALTKIRLRHDNSGLDPSWFVQEVRISENTPPHRQFYFPCNQWLAINEDDGRIVRELAVGIDALSESSESTWTLMEDSPESSITRILSLIYLFLIFFGSHLHLSTAY